ncbi:MAG: NADH-quinone oxidoreductase subunit C [Mycobacteriales bacterium]
MSTLDPDTGGTQPVVVASNPVAERSAKTGLFGAAGSGDTSGFGGLVRTVAASDSSPRPFGGYFDDVVDSLVAALATAGAPTDTIGRIIVDRGELTLHLRPDTVLTVCTALRDDPALRFELCSSVSGVDYLDATTGTDSATDAEIAVSAAATRLHVVYHLTSMTYRRRIRLEAAVTARQPHVPSVTSVYPTVDWQERETYDMFGVVFDGHPALTRILMPDDWDGYPQRKDYPLGGVPVEYKGAQIPPPDNRRAYQ